MRPTCPVFCSGECGQVITGGAGLFPLATAFHWLPDLHGKTERPPADPCFYRERSMRVLSFLQGCSQPCPWPQTVSAEQFPEAQNPALASWEELRWHWDRFHLRTLHTVLGVSVRDRKAARAAPFVPVRRAAPLGWGLSCWPGPPQGQPPVETSCSKRLSHLGRRSQWRPCC